MKICKDCLQEEEYEDVGLIHRCSDCDEDITPKECLNHNGLCQQCEYLIAN